MTEVASQSSQTHSDYMRLALSFAEKSPPKASKFRVGAIMVDQASNRILSTGYSLELPGNTHAEQCCLQKFAAEQGLPEAEVGSILPTGAVIYTTMEPCCKRLSGNLPCVERILRTRKAVNGGIKTVYVGVAEPEKFVEHNNGRANLEAAGVEFIHVPGLEQDILRVATFGH